MSEMKALSICLLTALVVGVMTTSAAQWTDLNVKGETVRIFRDGYGVPHVHAQSRYGLFYTMAYVVAQDRFTQLENNRRYARGRLSEIYGDQYLVSDQVWSRDLYTDDEWTAQFNQLRPDTQEIFNAYVDGVNARMQEVLNDKDHLLPKEFWDWGILPEPWTLQDSLSMAVVMLRRFGQRGAAELANLQKLQTLGQAEFDKEYPINVPDAPVTIPSGSEGGFPGDPPWVCPTFPSLFGGAKALHLPQIPPASLNNTVAAMDAEQNLLATTAYVIGFPVKIGSYGIEIGAKRSTSGKAFLLACPWMHIEVPASPPSSSNEVDLHGAGYDVAGVNFAGVPGIYIGHTNYFAWTDTSSFTDDTDTFVETTDPNNPYSYYYNGQWVPMTSRDFVIKVKGEADNHYTAYRTIHGPVVQFDTANNVAYSWKQTSWGHELESVEAFCDFARAKSVLDWRDAVKKIAISFNIHYADIDGNIAFILAGYFRIPGPGVDPRLPASGNGTQEWLRLLDFTELPQSCNPAQGYFANYNNKPTVWWPNGDIGYFTNTNHVTPMMQMVELYPKLSVEQFYYFPQVFNIHGTYEQVIEATPPFSNAWNIQPPGQDNFTDKNGNQGTHVNDQQPLYDNWQRKPFLYFQYGEPHQWTGFAHQPRDAQVYAGNAFTLSADVGWSDWGLTYTWWCNTETSSIRIDGNTPTLVIGPAKLSDAGQYWCQIDYGGASYYSNLAAVSVAEHLAITRPPSGAAVHLGNPYTLGVATSGGFPPLNYAWKHNDRVIGENSSCELRYVDYPDLGAYSVEIRDSFGDVVVSDPVVVSEERALPLSGLACMAAIILAGVVTGARRMRAK